MPEHAHAIKKAERILRLYRQGLVTSDEVSDELHDAALEIYIQNGIESLTHYVNA